MSNSSSSVTVVAEVAAAAQLCDNDVKVSVSSCVNSGTAQIDQCPPLPTGSSLTAADRPALVCICSAFRDVRLCFNSCPAGLNALTSTDDLKSLYSVCDLISPAESTVSQQPTLTTSSAVPQATNDPNKAVLAAADFCDASSSSSTVSPCVKSAFVLVDSCAAFPANFTGSKDDQAAFDCNCEVYRVLLGCFKSCSTGQTVLATFPYVQEIKDFCATFSPGQSLTTTIAPPTVPTSSTVAKASTDGGGLSTGAVAGIGAGAALVVLVAIGLAIFFGMRSKKSRDIAAKTPAAEASPPAPFAPPTPMPADASYYSYPSQQSESHQPLSDHGQYGTSYSGQHSNNSQQSAPSSNEKASGLFANTAPSESQRLPYYATPSQHSNGVSSNGTLSQPSQMSTNQSYSQYSAAPAPDYQTRMMGPGGGGGGGGGSVAGLPGYNPQMANGAAYAAPANEKEYWRG